MNVFGTEQLIKAAMDAGVGRLIFAGSIASLDPPVENEVLTEKTPAGRLVPYSRSKAEGERLLARYASRLPSVVLRIGGVFSDWCELPPLCSLIKQWKQPGILGRLMPGMGKSGFPFIHRKDLVSAVRRIVEIEERLDKYQVLFVSPDTHTSYRQLFPAIRSYVPGAVPGPPINVPAFFISPILRSKKYAARLRGSQAYERAWMLKFLDKPLRTDCSYSRAKLAWRPSDEYRIEKRIPVLMEHAIRQTKRWEERNVLRSQGRYSY